VAVAVIPNHFRHGNDWEWIGNDWGWMGNDVFPDATMISGTQAMF
jgi:hypothetical protein